MSDVIHSECDKVKALSSQSGFNGVMMSSKASKDSGE